MNEVPEVFPAYRLVAEFADGQRLAFDGLTEQQAQDRMEAAQARHGDICSSKSCKPSLTATRP